MRKAPSIGLSTGFVGLVLTGCGPRLETNTTTWPNGKTAHEYRYYLKSSSDWTEVKHGKETWYNLDGTIFTQGMWRKGEPWHGLIWTPAAGDAGSAGGLGRYVRYEEGREMGQVSVPHGMWGAPP
jgi:hypothetical protein